MDPINNQQQGTPQQEIVQPQNTAPAVEQQATQYPNPNTGKSNRGTTIFLMVILLVFILGLLGYLVYFNGKSNNSEIIPVTTSSFPSPSSVSQPIPPTVQPIIDDLNLEDPETDIKALDTDAQSL